LQRSTLRVAQRADVTVVDGTDRRLVEACCRGNCQADAQSSAAVVVPCAAQANEFGGDRVDAIESYDRSGKAPERRP
jgi:hypothetical protein